MSAYGSNVPELSIDSDGVSMILIAIQVDVIHKNASRPSFSAQSSRPDKTQLTIYGFGLPA